MGKGVRYSCSVCKDDYVEVSSTLKGDVAITLRYPIHKEPINTVILPIEVIESLASTLLGFVIDKERERDET